jgi:thioredoxin-related protein
MKKLFLLLSFIPSILSAQDKGIHFEHGLSWQQVQAKAKTENKYVFMDCFTTWCGPCRFMSANIFPLQDVGDSMNAHFISVAVQLDTTAGDNAEIKSWYQSGHDITQQYKVQVYPTYLIFDANGKIVHRFVGSSDAHAFLSRVATALNPETQYYTMLDQYKAGKKDTAFLHSLALTAADAYDLETAGTIANEYIAAQSNLYTKSNLDFIGRFTHSSKDKGFDLLLNHGDKVDAVMGIGASDKIVRDIILSEEVFPKIFGKKIQSPKELPEPDWTAIQSAIQTKYPAHVKEIMAYSKIVFYQNKGDWNNFAPAVVAYMKLYGNTVSDNQLNDFAWNVFLNCSDMTCVAEALDWSKRSFEKEHNPAFIDTYANILYKMGKKDEAIQWEGKALSLSAESDKKGYQETIDKMKKGEKTWN